METCNNKSSEVSYELGTRRREKEDAHKETTRVNRSTEIYSRYTTTKNTNVKVGRGEGT